MSLIFLILFKLFLILILKLILRSKFIFKTPEKHNLIVFDEESVNDLNICLLKSQLI